MASKCRSWTTCWTLARRPFVHFEPATTWIQHFQLQMHQGHPKTVKSCTPPRSEMQLEELKQWKSSTFWHLVSWILPAFWDFRTLKPYVIFVIFQFLDVLTSYLLQFLHFRDAFGPNLSNSDHFTFEICNHLVYTILYTIQFNTGTVLHLASS